MIPKTAFAGTDREYHEAVVHEAYRPDFCERSFRSKPLPPLTEAQRKQIIDDCFSLRLDKSPLTESQRRLLYGL